MKRLAMLLLTLSLFGCVTVKIPKYLQDEFPYRRSFEASFERTFESTLRALKNSGWKISETTSPVSLAPKEEVAKTKKYEALIFTEIKQSPLFLTTSYSSLNVLLKTVDAVHTDVEIRYLSMFTLPFLPFKNINTYQNDKLMQRIFKNIELYLKR